ncbi:MAG TPA: RNA polymerase sigma factor [Methylomirabilota bacterium]|jgi:RNA polymerase sigma factor (sigma-70 family)|nr:RNA polymerase sigma factor [Methylomirabilota bacterium]
MGLEPFETAVEAHHAEIYRYLVRVTTRRTEADDLSQETFLRAYRAWDALGPGANVRAWLFAIATNLARNHFRTESRRRRAYAAVSDARTDRDPASPEEERRYRETRALVERVVDGLPPKQRLAFVLRKLHDLEYDAIGESLACSPESARAHVFQALKKIRVSLNGHELPPMESVR